jgi:hypothetical protein
MIKRLTIALVSIFSFMALAVSPTLAAKNSSPAATPLGNDISWPQCGKTLPSGQAFGIVGVNGGKANNFNPCFASELNWAQSSSLSITAQPAAQLYLNTGNPGDVLAQYNVTDWPTSSVAADPFGPCSGTWTDNQACSWEYGYERAQADAANVGSPAYNYWLDVETGNSWTNDYGKNQAALGGMVYYLEQQGSTVGLYSTSYQWGQIAGTNNPGGNLNGLPSWLPGARNQKTAKSNCALAPLTAGGTVTTTQFVSGSLDYDYSCI